ncbi:hypothetical protein E2C01_089648 [Portunus trituberculatus]|uniref:Uncharacterized protein n=1 Tax=Portunus trituberculatus TaxID=210409 RepID=A0A5B7JN05_PORTR|nr:hypothetical protein [Portunus trituberculatus]
MSDFLNELQSVTKWGPRAYVCSPPSLLPCRPEPLTDVHDGRPFPSHYLSRPFSIGFRSPIICFNPHYV